MDLVSCEGAGVKIGPRSDLLSPALAVWPNSHDSRRDSDRQTNVEMVQYISPQQLEALIKSKSDDYLVVDVRDDDYRGGHIKGGINIPSEIFMLKLHQLIDDTQNISKIIFHCAFSQQRWVYLAHILSKSSSSPQKRSKSCTGKQSQKFGPRLSAEVSRSAIYRGKVVAGGDHRCELRGVRLGGRVFRFPAAV